MGKTTADIEREIELQRELISRRLQNLEDRVSDDVRDTGKSVTHKFESASQQVDETLHISEQVEQRPFTVLLGALGVGFMLGMMSDRGGGSRDSGAGKRKSVLRYDRGERGQQTDDGGIVSELMGTASGFISGTLGNELKDFVRDVLSELRDGSRSQRTEAPETRFRSQYDGATYDDETRSSYRPPSPGKREPAGRANGAA